MPEVFELIVNGVAHRVEAPGSTLLLHVLRGKLGLVATRFGCGAEACGACMVLIENRPVNACTLPIDAIGTHAITTAEGLGRPDKPHPLQQAFIDEQAGQCGFCLSGILVSAKALLDANPTPSRADITIALDRHLCRCGAHNRIIAAVERAGMAMRGEVRP